MSTYDDTLATLRQRLEASQARGDIKIAQLQAKQRANIQRLKLQWAETCFRLRHPIAAIRILWQIASHPNTPRKPLLHLIYLRDTQL